MPIRIARNLTAQLHETVTKWVRRRGAMNGNMLALGVPFPGWWMPMRASCSVPIPFNAVNLPLQKCWPTVQVTAMTITTHVYAPVPKATDGAAAETSHFVYFSINTLRGRQVATRLLRVGPLSGGSIYRGAFYGPATESSAGAGRYGLVRFRHGRAGRSGWSHAGGPGRYSPPASSACSGRSSFRGRADGVLAARFASPSPLHRRRSGQVTSGSSPFPPSRPRRPWRLGTRGLRPRRRHSAP